MAELKTCRCRRARLATCVALLAVLPTPALALTINGGSNAGNNRFASGFPTSPVANSNPSFIGAGYDWSGVGWVNSEPTMGVALLGPDQVLLANHYHPAVGATLTFSSSTGGTISDTVASLQGTHAGYTNDMVVGTLAAPIPASANVCYYSILFQGYSPSAYVGDTVLLYGYNFNVSPNVPWIGASTITAAGQLLLSTGTQNGQFGGDSSQYMYLGYNTSTPNQAIVQGGDSGSPTFLVYGGQLYLAGAHYLLDTGQGSIDTFTSLSLPTLDSYMGQSGYLPYVVTPVTAQWTGSGSGTGSWANSTSWSTTGGASTSVPADVMSSGSVATCASVLFNGATTSQTTVSLDGSQTVTSITFANAPGANAFTLTGTDLLTIGEAGITNQSNSAQNINCPVALRTSQRWAVGAGGLNVNGSIDLGSGAAGNLLLVEGTGNTTLNGALAGSTGSFAIDGGGTVTLANSANSYGGQTFINGGTLLLGAAGALPAASNVTISGGTLDLGGNLASAGTVTLQSGAIADGSLSATAFLAASGAISANLGGGSLTKSASGTLTLSGTNTYGGNTIINAGNLVFSSVAAIPAGTGNIILNSGGALNVTGAYSTVSGWLASGNLNISSGGALALTAISSSETISMVGFPSLSLGAAATTIYTGTLTPTVSTYKLGGGGGTLILPGNDALTGANALVVGNAGPGTVVLAGANDYNGNTTISGGTLQLGVAGAIPSGPGKGNVAVSGLLDLAGNSATINGLSGSGSVDNSGTCATTLTVGANNASSTFAGLITNSGTAAVAAATLSLVKTGTGVLTLTGTNAYTGPTTVSGGTLVVADPGALPSESLISVGRAGQINLCGLLSIPLPDTTAPASSPDVSTDFADTVGATLAPAAPGLSIASGAGAAVLPAESDFSFQPVPEPATLGLLAAAGLAAWSWRLLRRPRLRGPS